MLIWCADAEGSIANSMAGRAKEFETKHFIEGYAKTFASALLDENCKGGKVLTDETRQRSKIYSERDLSITITEGTLSQLLLTNLDL